MALENRPQVQARGLEHSSNINKQHKNKTKLSHGIHSDTLCLAWSPSQDRTLYIRRITSSVLQLCFAFLSRFLQRQHQHHQRRQQQQQEADMGGGTEAFPDLGRHCQNPDCRQLDFLPFKCDGCHKVFCLEHRSYKSHECQKQDIKSRKVIVCDVCSVSIETTGCNKESEKTLLEKHVKSGDCDPKKHKKPTCPVRRCKEVLTFSNTSTCKTCNLTVCLKHRFPADHACNKKDSMMVGKEAVTAKGRWQDRFLVSFASRNGKECTKTDRSSSKASPSKSTPSVKAY